MNTRVATLGYTAGLHRGGRATMNGWHYAAGVGLLLAMLLGETLPSALILPAFALVFLVASFAAMAVSFALHGARRESARLVAAIAVALAVAASVLTDVHHLVPYLR
jgi:hypothetical protein